MSLPQHGNRKRNQGGHEDRGQSAGRDTLCGPAASWTTQERVEACQIQRLKVGELPCVLKRSPQTDQVKRQRRAAAGHG